MPEQVFAHGPFILRRMEDTPQDYARMAGWLSDPRVLEFYEGRDHPFPLKQVIEKYAPRVLSSEGVQPCIMEYDGRSIGYLQFYLADPGAYQFEQDGAVYALDLFIGEPDCWGQGLGSRFVQLLLAHLFAETQAGWVILDPHVDNPRAIRAYEKCGFRKVKLLPEHEWHEGRRVDCWLMAVKKPDT